MRSVVLVGSSGLVGCHVLARLLEDERFGRVIAPRRQPAAPHPQLLVPIVDFEALPAQAEWWAADAVICTLGTTIREAGSRQAFQRVDHDYPLTVAELARSRGTPTFVLNSALGADASSRVFYSRVKGELEKDLAKLGFTSLTFARPGLIGGDREEPRPLERSASIVLGAVGPLLPRRYRINPAAKIAKALTDAAADAKAGVHVVSSASMT